VNQTDYQKWMEKAFLYIEAALAMELATPSRVCMSEEYLRSSFVRGLSHSYPSEASRVSIEWDAPWTDSPCWKDGVSIPGQGRKIQHDIRITPEVGTAEQGLACEAKWLKHAKADEIVRDMWKLMLSRSIVAHGTALRCYLLVGGEGKSFQNTMDTLRKSILYLNWRDDSDAATEISLNALAKKTLGKNALKALLSWSQKKHVRTPPPCLRNIRCVRRASWYRTLDGTKWRMGLWELTSWGAGIGNTVDWNARRAALIA
jgi:hypothetical protein